MDLPVSNNDDPQHVPFAHVSAVHPDQYGSPHDNSPFSFGSPPFISSYWRPPALGTASQTLPSSFPHFENQLSRHQDSPAPNRNNSLALDRGPAGVITLNADFTKPASDWVTSLESSVAHQDTGSKNCCTNHDQGHSSCISCVEHYPPYTPGAPATSQQTRLESKASQSINGFDAISDQAPTGRRTKTTSVDGNSANVEQVKKSLWEERRSNGDRYLERQEALYKLSLNDLSLYSDKALSIGAWETQATASLLLSHDHAVGINWDNLHPEISTQERLPYDAPFYAASFDVDINGSSIDTSKGVRQADDYIAALRLDTQPIATLEHPDKSSGTPPNSPSGPTYFSDDTPLSFHWTNEAQFRRCNPSTGDLPHTNDRNILDSEVWTVI